MGMVEMMDKEYAGYNFEIAASIEVTPSSQKAKWTSLLCQPMSLRSYTITLIKMWWS